MLVWTFFGLCVLANIQCQVAFFSNLFQFLIDGSFLFILKSFYIIVRYLKRFFRTRFNIVNH